MHLSALLKSSAGAPDSGVRRPAVFLWGLREGGAVLRREEKKKKEREKGTHTQKQIKKKKTHFKHPPAAQRNQ